MNNVKALDRSGQAMLNLAEQADSPAIVQLLIDAGATA